MIILSDAVKRTAAGGALERPVGRFCMPLPSAIHSIFTLVMLWRGIGFARRGNIKAHSRTMEYLYFLALVVTGLLTFIPGRIMYRVAFGQDGPTLQKLLVFAGVIAAAAVLSGLAAMWRKTRAGIEFVEAH